MIQGNQAWFAYSKQDDLGTPVDVPLYKAPYSGGSRLKGSKTHGQYAETDSSVDAAPDYVQQLGAAGAPQALVRDEYAHILLEAGMGARTTTAAAPNYTHDIVPGMLSLWTVHQMFGGQIFEQAEDIKVNTMTIAGSTGEGITIALDSMGRKNLPLLSDPAGAVPLASGTVYNYNDLTATLSGQGTAYVRSFELTYDNGVQLLNGSDQGVPFDVYSGVRTVSGSFDFYFANLDEYNLFYYGTTTPAALDPQSSEVRVTDLAFNLAHGANNAISLSLPRIGIQEFPADPATSSDPVVVSVRFRAQRGGTPVLTAQVKNQVA